MNKCKGGHWAGGVQGWARIGRGWAGIGRGREEGGQRAGAGRKGQAVVGNGGQEVGRGRQVGQGVGMGVTEKFFRCNKFS